MFKEFEVSDNVATAIDAALNSEGTNVRYVLGDNILKVLAERGAVSGSDAEQEGYTRMYNEAVNLFTSDGTEDTLSGGTAWALLATFSDPNVREEVFGSFSDSMNAEFDAFLQELEGVVSA